MKIRQRVRDVCLSVRMWLTEALAERQDVCPMCWGRGCQDCCDAGTWHGYVVEGIRWHSFCEQHEHLPFDELKARYKARQSEV